MKISACVCVCSCDFFFSITFGVAYDVKMLVANEGTSETTTQVHTYSSVVFEYCLIFDRFHMIQKTAWNWFNFNLLTFFTDLTVALYPFTHSTI